MRAALGALLVQVHRRAMGGGAAKLPPARPLPAKLLVAHIRTSVFVGFPLPGRCDPPFVRRLATDGCVD